jgi:hypothetical protein
MLSASLAAAEMNEGAVAAESGLKAAGRCASERKRSWEDGGGGVEGERAGVSSWSVRASDSVPGSGFSFPLGSPSLSGFPD